MENKFIHSNFLKQWILCLLIIFSPGFLLSTIVTGISLYLAISYKDNIQFSNTMAIIGSIFGGVAGAFLKDEYDKKSGKNILEKKGLSAIRNLKGIDVQLINIKTWVEEFSRRAKRKENKQILEEINRHITTIKLNINSGLEDWVDIVPELKEQSQKEAEINKKYKETAQSVLVELLEKRKELATVKDEKIEQELKKKINDLERQIKEIKKERSQAVNNIAFSATSGINESVGVLRASSLYASSIGNKFCTRCGRRLNNDYFSASHFSTIGDNNYCDECKRELGII